MVGWPTTAWHLELVDDPTTASASLTTASASLPTEEDLLVLYLGGPVDGDTVQRLTHAGGRRVQARNPTGSSGASRSPTRTATASS